MCIALTLVHSVVFISARELSGSENSEDDEPPFGGNYMNWSVNFVCFFIITVTGISVLFLDMFVKSVTLCL